MSHSLSPQRKQMMTEVSLAPVTGGGCISGPGSHLGLVAAGFCGQCSGCCQLPCAVPRSSTAPAWPPAGPSRPPGKGVTVLAPRNLQTSREGKDKCVWSVCLVHRTFRAWEREQSHKSVPQRMAAPAGALFCCGRSEQGCQPYLVQGIGGVKETVLTSTSRVLFYLFQAELLSKSLSLIHEHKWL